MNGQIVPIKEKAATVKSMIEGYKAQIAAALPKHISADRMLRVIMTDIQRNPKILDCTPASLIGAVLESSQLGLEPGVLGESYLVPFRNGKTGKSEIQLIVGYKGLIKLSRNSRELSTIYARAVHGGDRFKYRFGTDPMIVHEPAPDADEEVHYVYAVARLKDGGIQFDVMTRAEIDRIRTRSRAKDSGPWVTDFEAMSLKTVLRRLCKLLPTSVEVQRAVALDELAEAGISQELDVIDLPTPKAIEEPEGNGGNGGEEKPKTKLDQVVADRKTAKQQSKPVVSEWGEGADPDPFLERDPGQEG